MKELHLIRHAKSENSTGDSPDIDRQLSDRGKRDIELVGSRLAKSGISIDLLCTSPAVRARTTAALFTDAIGQSYEVHIEDVLYGKGEASILDFIKRIDDKVGSLAIVSHNPDMTGLANLLGDSHIESLPTCSVLSIGFETDHWDTIDQCNRKTTRYDYPKKPV